jgi:Ulp1 protease family, C-terminal catalytic domain
VPECVCARGVSNLDRHCALATILAPDKYLQVRFVESRAEYFQQRVEQDFLSREVSANSLVALAADTSMKAGMRSREGAVQVGETNKLSVMSNDTGVVIGSVLTRSTGPYGDEANAMLDGLKNLVGLVRDNVAAPSTASAASSASSSSSSSSSSLWAVAAAAAAGATVAAVRPSAGRFEAAPAPSSSSSSAAAASPVVDLTKDYADEERERPGTTRHSTQPAPHVRKQLLLLDNRTMINDEIVNWWGNLLRHNLQQHQQQQQQHHHHHPQQQQQQQQQQQRQQQHRWEEGQHNVKQHAAAAAAAAVGGRGGADTGAVAGAGTGGSTVVLLSSLFYESLTRRWKARAHEYAYDRSRVHAQELVDRKFEAVQTILIPVHIPGEIHWVLVCVQLTRYSSADDNKIRVRVCACARA